MFDPLPQQAHDVLRDHQRSASGRRAVRCLTPTNRVFAEPRLQTVILLEQVAQHRGIHGGSGGGRQFGLDLSLKRNRGIATVQEDPINLAGPSRMQGKALVYLEFFVAQLSALVQNTHPCDGIERTAIEQNQVVPIDVVKGDEQLGNRVVQSPRIERNEVSLQVVGRSLARALRWSPDLQAHALEEVRDNVDRRGLARLRIPANSTTTGSGSVRPVFASASAPETNIFACFSNSAIRSSSVGMTRASYKCSQRTAPHPQAAFHVACVHSIREPCAMERSIVPKH